MTMTSDWTSEVELSDPDDLTQDETKLLEILKAVTPDEFDTLLRRHVAAPTESTQFVYRHPSIVELTRESLLRLRAAAEQRRQHAQNKRQRTLADDQVKKYSRELKAIAPFYNLALAEAAKNTPRRRAEVILGQLHYGELTKIRRDLEAGMSEKDATARARERMAEGRKSPKSAKT